MCNKNTRTRKQPARRSRTRTRKPKYLSLSKHIKTESDSKSPPPSTAAEMPRELKTLFPLHPESSLAAEDRSSGDENVAMLFQADVASDLTALLQAQTTTSSSDRDDASFNHRRSLMYDNEDDDSLVKSAMKRNSDEGNRSEEKWVCYSEVVEEVTSTSNTSAVSRSKRKSKRKMKMKKEGELTTTTTSSSATTTMSKSLSSPSLALKLNYEGILNAWSDKGSFIVRGEDDQLLSSPQTVPDLHCELGLTDGWGSSAANVWTVPESGCVGIKEECEGLKSEQREASVLRYKEKRQSRLFAKRIRYEVRKLNAEKRPRIKGRFVKIG